MSFPINPLHRLLLETGDKVLQEDGTSFVVLDEIVALDNPLNAASTTSLNPALTFVGEQLAYSPWVQTVFDSFNIASGTPFTLPVSTTVGNTLLLVVRNLTSGSLTSVSDSKGNTYTVDVQTTAGTTNIAIVRALIVNRLVAGDTITAVGTTGVNIQANEYRGIIAVSPLDKSNSTTGTGLSDSAGTTGTLTSIPQLVFSAVACVSAQTFVPPVGFNEHLPTTTTGVDVADMVVNNTGALNPTWNWTASAAHGVAIATYFLSIPVTYEVELNNAVIPLLAIDSSTPAYTAIPKAVTSATTASFSPPANSLISIHLSVDGVDTAAQSVIAMTDNLGTHLNWQLMPGSRSNAFSAAGGTLGGTTEVWWAYTTASQTGMTVSPTFALTTGGGGTNAGGLQVIVWQNAYPYQGIGGSAARSDATTVGSAPNMQLRTQFPNSWVVASVINYKNSTTPTVGSGQTVTIDGQSAQLADGTTGSAWWTQILSATTPSAGTTVLLNDTAPTGIQFNMSAVEIVALNDWAAPLIDASSDHATGFVDDATGQGNDKLLLEDGISFLLLEDGTSKLVIDHQHVAGNYTTYTVQPANTLTNATTYYWRSRIKQTSPTPAVTRSQTFTAGSAFTVPANVTQILVEAWGAGGGGGGGTGVSLGGAGGGGGAYSQSVFAVVPGQTYTVTVGAGGLGIVNATGGTGGDTWFNTATTLLAKGGAGGAANTASGPAGGAASSGIGTVKQSGGAGGGGSTGAGGGSGGSGGSTSDGGAGGLAGVGVGGTAGTAGTVVGGAGAAGSSVSSTNGTNGSVPGGAGSGGGNGTGQKGGNGAVGQITITYTTPTIINSPWSAVQNFVASSSASVALSQVAAIVTATGGAQTVSTSGLVNAAIAQVAATATATGGTQVVASANNVSIAQLAANITATGGTQTIAAVSSVALAQVAATLTATGGTQTVAAANSIAITQVAAAITATGGTQTIATVNNVALAQVAAVITATGGTQTVATFQQATVAQVAAVVTATGGTQAVVAHINVALAQVAATITATGGTQSVASINNVAISQVAATVTATGGTQTVTTLQTAAIAQVAATITATGGTQAVASSNKVAITQVAAVVTATGGTQVVAAVRNISVSQVGAVLTITTGTQAVTAIHSSTVTITQVAANLLVTGGIQTAIVPPIFVPIVTRVTSGSRNTTAISGRTVTNVQSGGKLDNVSSSSKTTLVKSTTKTITVKSGNKETKT